LFLHPHAGPVCQAEPALDPSCIGLIASTGLFLVQARNVAVNEVW
jgi:hypothetical protein